MKKFNYVLISWTVWDGAKYQSKTRYVLESRQKDFIEQRWLEGGTDFKIDPVPEYKQKILREHLEL